MLKSSYLSFIFWIFCISPLSAETTNHEIKLDLPTHKTEDAQTKKSITFGHLLSPTTYTLKKNDFSLGNLFAGLGVTDELTLGVSPWMLGSYNMYNALIRYRIFNEPDWQFGQQFGYFKTYTVSRPHLGYQMEALSLWNTLSHRISPVFTAHYNLNIMYFFDETIPFSLRQEPGRNHAYQVSPTVLLESALTQSWGLLAEFGLMGLDYSQPNPHVGSSLYYRSKIWLIQIGYSLTALRQQHVSNTFRPQGKRDVAVHPEIALQATF